MPKTILGVTGDRNVIRRATIFDADSSQPIDLTGADVVIHFRKRGNTDGEVTIAASFVTDGSDGRIEFVMPEACFVEAGIFECEAQVTSGGEVVTTPITQKFKIREQLG